LYTLPHVLLFATFHVDIGFREKQKKMLGIRLSEEHTVQRMGKKMEPCFCFGFDVFRKKKILVNIFSSIISIRHKDHVVMTSKDENRLLIQAIFRDNIKELLSELNMLCLSLERMC
jgi:hypothetical protein